MEWGHMIANTILASQRSQPAARVPAQTERPALAEAQPLVGAAQADTARRKATSKLSQTLASVDNTVLSSVSTKLG